MSILLIKPHTPQGASAGACWQMPSPPQSLHWYLCRACWQMLAPPHSLHRLLLRLCWPPIVLALAPSPIVLADEQMPAAAAVPRARSVTTLYVCLVILYVYLYFVGEPVLPALPHV